MNGAAYRGTEAADRGQVWEVDEMDLVWHMYLEKGFGDFYYEVVQYDIWGCSCGKVQAGG